MPPVELRRTAFTQGPAQPAGAMSPDQNYMFDVGGFIHIPDMLNTWEVDACTAVLDDAAVANSDPTTMEFFEGSCTAAGCDGLWGAPFARLLGHPVLTSYLDELCGEGHRLDVAPALLPIMCDDPAGAGTGVELVGGGGGDITSRRVAYYHSNGMRLAQGVRVVFALADAPAGAGGLVLLPCSHRSVVPTPHAVAAGTDRASSALLQQPVLHAGDVLLLASTTLRGLRPWQGPGPHSRRRDCHSADTPCLSLLKSKKGRGGCSRMTVSPTARSAAALQLRVHRRCCLSFWCEQTVVSLALSVIQLVHHKVSIRCVHAPEYFDSARTVREHSAFVLDHDESCECPCWTTQVGTSRHHSSHLLAVRNGPRNCRRLEVLRSDCARQGGAGHCLQVQPGHAPP